jgi:16S rRNA (cytosine1402-N4)-methyltransferase
LAVVTFHSVEDRMVKRFLTARSGGGGNANRFAPETERAEPQFKVIKKKAIGPDAQELDENPRSRSAKLRVAIRTDAPAGRVDAKSLGMPMVKGLLGGEDE